MEQYRRIFKKDCACGLSDRLREVLATQGIKGLGGNGNHLKEKRKADSISNNGGGGRGGGKGSSSPPWVLPSSSEGMEKHFGPAFKAKSIEDLKIQEPMYSVVWVRDGTVEVKTSVPFSKVCMYCMYVCMYIWCVCETRGHKVPNLESDQIVTECPLFVYVCCCCIGIPKQ